MWTEGGSRLLDYGGDGPAVLFVPSLVNRAYVLDLAPGHSMLRWLASHGVRPLLLDWGWPGPDERRFTLTDYVAGRLERAMAAARAVAGETPVLAGYCMGGTLAVAAAQRRPELVRGAGAAGRAVGFPRRPIRNRRWPPHALLPLLEPLLAFNHTLPIDVLQTLFALLDPFGVADKYRGFARLDPDSERARLFVALEDWLNDGIPLAAPVAREVPRRLVWRERAGARTLADRRPAGGSRGAAPAGVRRRAGAGPDRAAGIRPAAGGADRGRGAARAAGRAYRHGRRTVGRTRAVAAAGGMGRGVARRGLNGGDCNKLLPLPLREGVGGRGRAGGPGTYRMTPPPNPLPQGEGEYSSSPPPPPYGAGYRYRDHPAQRPAGEQVHVEMRHFLPAVRRPCWRASGSRRSPAPVASPPRPPRA